MSEGDKIELLPNSTKTYFSFTEKCNWWFWRNLYVQPSNKSVALRETLGKAMLDGAENAAFVWFTSQLYASKYSEVGAAVNMLMDANYCDPLAKTPYHKNVQVRLKKVS